MPPKQAQPSKKNQEKVKTKIIEDKTFGLKNKKGAKQQKFIQQVQKQVQNKFQQAVPVTAEERERKKEEEKRKKEELSMLFKPVLPAQQIAKGVDPKSVVCVYFKQGLCQKGDKCKFSHDLTIERKAEKRNIYEDTRDGNKDNMEGWDEKELEDVINKRHGEDNKKKNQTQIVCKYFIEAVENKTYGWFWNCPNGENCMYRHALPPGFTLKSDAKKKDEGEKISLEMLIEKERASLGNKVTKVTLESFLAWKARKITEKKDERKKADDKKKADFKLGFMNGLTGRDIFTFNPDMIANDDEDAENDIDYRHRADDEEQEPTAIREINADFFASQAKEVDDTGTIATADRFDYLQNLMDKEREDRDKLDMACGGDEEGEEGEQEDGEEGGEDEEDEEEGKNLDIDESLFNAEDLQDLDDELEKLEI